MRYATTEVRNDIHMTSPITAQISGNNIMAAHTKDTNAIHTSTEFKSR